MPELDYTDPQSKRRIRVITPQAQIGPNDYDVLNQAARNAKDGDTVYYNFPDAPAAVRPNVSGLRSPAQPRSAPQTGGTFGQLDLSTPQPLAAPSPSPLSLVTAPRPVPTITPRTIRPTPQTRVIPPAPRPVPYDPRAFFGSPNSPTVVQLESPQRLAALKRNVEAEQLQADPVTAMAGDFYGTPLSLLGATGARLTGNPKAAAREIRDMEAYRDVAGLGASNPLAVSGRSAVNATAPALGGFTAAAAGARFGGSIPGPPLVKAAGAIAGGLGGGLLGGEAVQQGQDALTRLLIGDEAFGELQKQRQADQAQNPTAAFIGEQAPNLLMGRVGGLTRASVLPRLTAGAGNAGFDAAMQFSEQKAARDRGETPEPYSYTRGVISGLTGFGLNGDRTGLGDTLHNGGDFAGGLFPRAISAQFGPAKAVRRVAPLEALLSPNGERLPFTLNPNWDAVENGKSPGQSFSDPRTPRAQKVRPVAPLTHPAIDSGIGGAGNNGVLLASAPGPINAMFNKAQERGHNRVMLSVGGRQMSVSNMDAANNIVAETRHIVDNLKTATPGQVNRAIKEAGQAFNSKRDVLYGEGVGKRAPSQMRLDDLPTFLAGLSFNDRAAFLKQFANKQNKSAGLSPYWRDIVDAMNDPKLVGRRANNGAAIGRLEEGGRALTAAEAGVPALKSYTHVGKGEFDGYLPELANWQGLESATPKTDKNGRLSPLGFQNSLPEVRLPLSYYAKNYGVNPRDISAQGVFNGYSGETGRPGGYGAGLGQPDVLAAGVDAGRGEPTGRVDGGRGSRPGYDTGDTNRGADSGAANDRPGGSANGAGAGAARPNSTPSDNQQSGLARLRGATAQPRRPVGTTDLSGDVPSGAAFNRDPNARRSDVAGQAATPEGSRRTTGAVSSFVSRPELDAKIARADELFSRDTKNPGAIDPATNEPYRKAALRLRREVEKAQPGYYQARNDAAHEEAVKQTRAKQAAEPKTEPAPQSDLFGGDLPPAKPRQKPPYEEKVDLSKVEVLPGLQYKTGTNRDAVTDQFAGETDFKIERAGQGTIFRKRGEGDTYTDYAVDLHHRTELFKRSKTQTVALPDGSRIDAPDKRVNVKVLDSRDGWTAESAKRYGIEQNLAENKGEPLDAAEGLLGAGTLDEARRTVASMQNGELKRNTAGIIELDSRGRELVANNKVDKAVAAAIGTVLKDDPERQKIALADAMKSRGIRNYDDGAKLATTVLYEPAVAKGDGAQGGLFDGDGFDSGYVSTAGKQTELEQSVRSVLQRAGSELLRPTGTTLREGETIDTAGRQAEAAQIADTRSKADALFSYDPQVRKALRDAATAVQSGKASDAEAAQLVQSVVQERGKLSVAEIVAGAGTQGERARPAPLPVRVRKETPAPAAQPEAAAPRKIEPVWSKDNPRPTMEQRRAALDASRSLTPPQTLTAPIKEDGQPVTLRPSYPARQLPPRPEAAAQPGRLQKYTSTLLKNPFKSKPNEDGTPTPSFLDNISSSRKLLLLTSPTTHARNVGSNAVMQQAEELAKLPASAADILRVQIARSVGGDKTPLGRAIGTNRTAGGLSVGQWQRATSEAVKKGLPEAWENFKIGHVKNGKFDNAGLDKEALGTSEGYASENETYNAIMNGIGRSLSSEDHVFKTYAWRRSIEEQAALIARAEKRSNPNAPEGYVKTRSAELSKTPTDAMNTQAITDAFVSTFNNDNWLNDRVGDARQKAGPLIRSGIDAVVPFSKTPSNVIARALEYSVLGMATGPLKAVSLVAKDLKAEKTLASERETYKTRPTSEQAEKIATATKAVMDKNFSPAEQRAMAQTFGRGATGAGMIYLGYRLAENGYMTGRNAGQSDYKKREEANEPEGAIYDPVSKRWYVVSDSVVGQMLTVGATIKEREGAGVPTIGGAAAAIGGLINDVPALSASDQIKNLSDTQNIGKTPGSLIGSVVPAVVANAAAQGDPMRRKQGADKGASVGAAIGQQLYRPLAARVPGLRQLLPANGPRKTSPFDPTKSQAGTQANPNLFKKKDVPQYTAPSSRGGSNFDTGEETGRRRGGRRRGSSEF